MYRRNVYDSAVVSVDPSVVGFLSTICAAPGFAPHKCPRTGMFECGEEMLGNMLGRFVKGGLLASLIEESVLRTLLRDPLLITLPPEHYVASFTPVQRPQGGMCRSVVRRMLMRPDQEGAILRGRT